MISNSLAGSRPLQAQASPQQLVTRHNAVIFYGIAAAALLESTIGQRAGAVLSALGADAESRDWIGRVWLPSKCEHAERTRIYVETLWPQFDWPGASDGFAADCRRLTRVPAAGAGIAQVALACLTAAAQAAMFYRGLAGAVDDPTLRQLLQVMAADETIHFEHFRGCYERHRQREHFGVLASYRTVVSCAYRARDVDVQLAFGHLNENHWLGMAPFQELRYSDFVTRLAALMRRKLPLGPAQLILFRPWFNTRSLLASPVFRPAPVAARQIHAARLAAGV